MGPIAPVLTTKQVGRLHKDPTARAEVIALHKAGGKLPKGVIMRTAVVDTRSGRVDHSITFEKPGFFGFARKIFGLPPKKRTIIVNDNGKIVG
jgi:hypothetical protein